MIVNHRNAHPFHPIEVLFITRNLPPLIGGMERLIWHMVEALSHDYHIHVIGPKGCKKSLPEKIGCDEIRTYPLLLFLWISKLITLWRAIRFRPQIVFAGSGLTAPFAWLAARMCRARSIVYLHGLDIDTAHPAYNLFWKPFIRRCDMVMVNSRFTRRLAVNAGILKQRIFILHPGVALPDYSKADAFRKNFRSRYNLDEKPVMLFVGRITARKGLAYFVEYILPKIIERIPEARSSDPRRRTCLFCIKADRRNAEGPTIDHYFGSSGPSIVFGPTLNGRS